MGLGCSVGLVDQEHPDRRWRHDQHPGRLHRRCDPLQLPEPRSGQLLDYGGTTSPALTRASASATLLTLCTRHQRNGTQLETVKTWGFRGAFTHNWDPYWNTALYGAYAGVRYGNLGKDTICALHRGDPGCRSVTTLQPGLQHRPARSITRWTPVKNLTFSADFTWTRLDQKYAGVWNAAQNNGVAKPGSGLRAQGSGQPDPAAPRPAQLVNPVDLI